jgi:DNA-binding transcriptional LysR family regulator
MSLTRFTLRQVEVFAAVAHSRGFTAAARELGLTVQAVSQSIAELESVLGFRLFDRSTRSVTLSCAGTDYLPVAQQLLRHARAAEEAAAEVRSGSAGVVRAGGPQTLAGLVLPRAARDYLQVRPKVSVRIRDVLVARLPPAVADGEVDLAIGPDLPTDERIVASPVWRSEWVLWCGPGDLLPAAAQAVRWEELRGVPLVAAGPEIERRLLSWLPDGRGAGRSVEVVDQLTTALGLASQGLAATLAPRYVGELARSFGLRMVRVCAPNRACDIWMYRHATRALSPAAQAFGEHLQAWLPRWHAMQETHSA